MENKRRQDYDLIDSKISMETRGILFDGLIKNIYGNRRIQEDQNNRRVPLFLDAASP